VYVDTYRRSSACSITLSICNGAILSGMLYASLLEIPWLAGTVRRGADLVRFARGVLRKASPMISICVLARIYSVPTAGKSSASPPIHRRRSRGDLEPRS
jgi:hypothetical protein